MWAVHALQSLTHEHWEAGGGEMFDWQKKLIIDAPGTPNTTRWWLSPWATGGKRWRQASGCTDSSLRGATSQRSWLLTHQHHSSHFKTPSCFFVFFLLNFWLLTLPVACFHVRLCYIQIPALIPAWMKDWMQDFLLLSKVNISVEHQCAGRTAQPKRAPANLSFTFKQPRLHPCYSFHKWITTFAKTKTKFTKT